jgi:hypothetical protein
MLAEINVGRKSGRFHTTQYPCSRAKRRAIFEPRYPVDARDVNNAANKEGFLWLAQKTMIPKISHHLSVENLTAVNDNSASPLLSCCLAVRQQLELTMGKFRVQHYRSRTFISKPGVNKCDGTSGRGTKSVVPLIQK